MSGCNLNMEKVVLMSAIVRFCNLLDNFAQVEIYGRDSHAVSTGYIITFRISLIRVDGIH